MSDVPSGWYDDPENPTQWRYWDGTAWTEHRSPKGVPADPGGSSGSVWQLVPNTFSIAGRFWREYTIISVPIVVLTMFGIVAAYVGFDQTLNVGVGEFFDRVSDPGFDPQNDPDDDLWWEALEFDLRAGAVVWWAVGALALLASGIGSVAVARFAIGAAHGGPPSPGRAYTGAIGRLLRLLGWALVLAAVWVVASVLVVLLAVITPLTLIITIPAGIVAAVWAVPYVVVAATVIIAAPRGTPPLPVARDLVTGRWFAFAGRFFILWIVVFAVSLPISFISGPLIAVSLLGGMLFSTLAQAVQGVIGQTGGALIYRWAGGPVDPELTAATVAEPD